jgi:hypothetical protein
MRRKKDDKRVLRSGNGRQKSSQKRRIRRNNRQAISKRPMINNKRNKPKRKANKSLVLIMIIALIAFVIGAGIGISFILGEDAADNAPHYKNVTKEMTSNLNETEQVYFEKDVDDVDFNENETSQLDVKYTYSDYTYKDY